MENQDLRLANGSTELFVCARNLITCFWIVNNPYFVYGSTEYHNLVSNMYSVCSTFRMMLEHHICRDGNLCSLCENSKQESDTNVNKKP